MEKTKKSFKSTLGILAVCVCAIIVVVVLALRSGGQKNEVIERDISVQEAGPLQINTGQIIDAVENPNVVAREGHRYRVIIDDESREGSSGIARIGGLVTFVADSRVGEELIVEVTRIKRSVAEAVVIERLGKKTVIRSMRRKEPSIDGKVYSARVSDVGRKGDGIVKRNGKVVFVPDVKKGDNIRYIIVEDRERTARGRVVSEEEAQELDPVIVEDRKVSASPAASGKEYRAVVKEMGRKGDALVWVDGKVTFLSGAQLGDEVVFRIVEDRGNFNIGQIVSKEDATATRKPELTEAVQCGEIYDVEVTERDRRNPEQNGVARIDGLVVFIQDSQPGDHLKIRIIDRQSRFARGEVIEKLTP